MVISNFFLCSIAFASSGDKDSIQSLIDDRINLVYEGSYYSNMEAALLEFRSISSLAREHQLWHKHLEVLINMAWCANHHNNMDSLSYFLKASQEVLKNKLPEIQKHDKEGESVVGIFHTSGMYYYGLNDFIKAIAEFKKIINYNASSTFKVDSLNISAAFTWIGDSYFKLLNLKEAKIYHELAIQWLPVKNFAYEDHINYNYYYGVNQSHLGKCNFEQAKRSADPGLYAVALQNYLNAIEAFNANKQQDIASLSTNYRRISQIFYEQEKYDSALVYLEKTVDLHKPTDISMVETNIYLGDVYLSQKKWSLALQHYNNGLDIVNYYVAGKHYRKAEISNRIGKLHHEQKNYSRALEFYQTSIENLVEGFKSKDLYSHPELNEVLSEKDLLQALLLKGQTFFRLYKSYGRESKNLTAAIQHYQLAADLVDKMRNHFQSQEYKQFIASSSNAIYENAIEAAFSAYQHTSDPEYVATAFYFAEKNKSRILLEAVKNSFATDFAAIPQEILDEERDIKSRVSFLNSELIKGKNANKTEKVNSIRNQLLELNLQGEKLTEAIKERHPAFYQLKYDTKVASIEEVKKGLHKNAAVLEYFYGDSAVYIFGISQHKVSFIKIKKDANLPDNLLQSYLSKVKSPPGINNKRERFQEFVDQSSLLYALLLKQSLDEIKGSFPIEALLIVPDGPLGYLPFEALFEGESKELKTVDYSKLNYLVKNYAIRYEFSATLSLYESQREKLNETKYAYVGFAPSYHAGPDGSSYKNLQTLKNNQSEVKKVSQLFDGLSFTGNEASKEAFHRYASQSNVLHLSMHALANDHDPLGSGLAFSLPKENKKHGGLPGNGLLQGESPRDGFLNLHELYNMSLNADLAILSACETGSGQLARGEGIISLGRAFKFAGCPNIVMSLWNANDYTTTGIMQQYSQYLLESINKDEALRKAKLKYLQNADNNLSHPYYWSTFILVGDSQPIQHLNRSWSFSWLSNPLNILIFIAAIALIILLVLFFKRRMAKP